MYLRIFICVLASLCSVHGLPACNTIVSTGETPAYNITNSACSSAVTALLCWKATGATGDSCYVQAFYGKPVNMSDMALYKTWANAMCAQCKTFAFQAEIAAVMTNCNSTITDWLFASYNPTGHNYGFFLSQTVADQIAPKIGYGYQWGCEHTSCDGAAARTEICLHIDQPGPKLTALIYDIQLASKLNYGSGQQAVALDGLQSQAICPSFHEYKVAKTPPVAVSTECCNLVRGWLEEEQVCFVSYMNQYLFPFIMDPSIVAGMDTNQTGAYIGRVQISFAMCGMSSFLNPTCKSYAVAEHDMHPASASTIGIATTIVGGAMSILL